MSGPVAPAQPLGAEALAQPAEAALPSVCARCIHHSSPLFKQRPGLLQVGGVKAQPFQYVPVFCTVLPPGEEEASYLEVTAMLLDTVFAPFIKERPICVMARGVLERLFDADRVDTLFEYTSAQQYTR